MNTVAKTFSLVAILLSLASGTAWATIECTAGSACWGTDGPNTMYGSASEDRICYVDKYDRVKGCEREY